MKRMMRYLAGGIFFAFTFMLWSGDDASAAYIDSASVSDYHTYCASWNDDGTCGSWGDTYFKVNINYGSDCSDCSQVALGSGNDAGYNFLCDDHGDGETTCIDDSATEVTYVGTWDGYDYYDVEFYPCNDGEQSMTGQIKKPAKVNFQARSINMNGNEVGNNPFHNENVDRGSSPSANAPAWVGDYRFRGWKGTSGGGSTCSTSLSNGSWYTVNGIYSDTTIYAVYAKDKTLTAKSIDTAGNSLAGVSGLEDQSTSVVHCNSASVTRGTAEGYTFLGWRNNSGDTSYTGGTNPTYTVGELTSNKTVYAVYERNKFSARARVKAGNSVDNTNTTKYYPWESGSVNAKDISIHCANSGCTAAYDLYMRTDAGTGSTGYQIGSSTNGGSISWLPSARTANTFSGAARSVGSGTDNFTPGQSACHYVNFRPYGTYANDHWETVRACAEAKITYFHGKSAISGAASGDTGWINSTPSSRQMVNINNCSPTAGCKVTFTHSLKRTNSIGSTGWKVTRTSNMIESTRAISNNNNVGSGTFSTNTTTPDQEGVVNTDGEHTLYPGMVVCETLTFKPSNNTMATVNDVHTEICASALGNGQPDDPPDPNDPGDPGNDPNGNSGSNAFVDIEVKNNTVTAYNTYRRIVYAKPNDSLTYRGSYRPILQYTYFLKPEQMKINSGRTIWPSATTINTSTKLGDYYDQHKGSSLKNWNNAFTVYSDNFTGHSGTISTYDNDTSFNYCRSNACANTNKTIYALGDFTRKSHTNNHTVDAAEVGSSLNETAKTNVNTTVQTTPGQVSFTDNSGKNLANVDTTARQKTAYARIPYNFVNTTEITTPETTIYNAGETGTFNINLITSPKRNNVTNGTYATRVQNAKWRLEVCYYDYNVRREVCQTTTPTKNADSMGNVTIGELNGLARGYKSGGDTINKTIKINIPDTVAGDQICLKASIYPANSGVDTNYNDEEGSHTWQESARKCYKVAKKPSIEIWGGNIYTRSSISAVESIKGHLFKYNDWKVDTAYPTKYVFSSWGELGIVSSGSIRGLSSGAALGFAMNNTTEGVWPAYAPSNGLGNNSKVQNLTATPPGGSTKQSVCNRSPLTFANNPCSGTPATVGTLGNSIAIRSADTDKSSILTRYAYSGDPNVSGTVTLDEGADKAKGEEVYYYYGGNGNLTVPTVQIGKGKTKVVHTNGDVTISGNINYENVPYASYNDMPRLIVFANNIKISCDVDRIDGILIAQHEVNTCVNNGGSTPDKNDRARSRRLTVNGAVISNTLKATRTYGAGLGANSVVSAEVVNFDPSLYLWGGQKIEGETVDANMDITYRKELAPRL